MKKKDDCWKWLYLSVILVIVPILFAFPVNLLVCNKALKLSEVIDSILVAVFSIAYSVQYSCNGLSKEKRGRFIRFSFTSSKVIAFLSWTLYVIKTANRNKYSEYICIAAVVIIVFFSVAGVIAEKQSYSDEERTFSEMHENCNWIRERLLCQSENDKLNSALTEQGRLICDPDPDVIYHVKREVAAILASREHGEDSGDAKTDM